MIQKSLTDVCVISENPFFINRIKLFSQNSNITFDFNTSANFKFNSNLFLVDINKLESFLTENPFPNILKFIVHGKQKDLKISFKAGCTDFLKEPWNNDELEARIFKIIGNTKGDIQWDMLLISNTSLSFDSLSTDISIEEYVILRKLLEYRGKAVPREALLIALWGRYKDKSRVIDVHISNLRKKILHFKKIDKLCCGDIKTVRSYGYLIS